MSDLIDRQAAIELAMQYCPDDDGTCSKADEDIHNLLDELKALTSAQPDRKYTNKELNVFRHGISLKLLSKRSAQHWNYDEDTAKEIEFLEQLYEKVSADIRGEHDE